MRTAREERGISQRALAAELDWSQSEVNRLGQYLFPAVSVVRLSEMVAVLGLELSAGLYRMGDPIHDKGQQPLIGRFTSNVAPPYVTTREVLLPVAGDTRSWDVLLRRESLLVGVEAETRIRDIQALVRRVRERERDGGVDEILIVLSDTAHNRSLVGQLREALGPRYSTSRTTLLAALRSGEPVPGSGVILL